MNTTSRGRRLLAGAAGLVIGAAGALAMAAPASAHVPKVSGSAECDTTTGEWVIQWSVNSFSEDGEGFAGTITNVTVVPPAPALTISLTDARVPAQTEGSLQEEVRVPGDTPQASLRVTVDFGEPDGNDETTSPTEVIDLSGQECTADGGGGGGDEPPDDQLPPELAADFFPVINCDFIVFFVNNRDEADGLSVAFTPNQDAVHGHAPDFLPFLDEFLDSEPGTVVEIPDDAGLVTDGDNVGPIDAGETTAAFGPFAPGDAHAHGFEAAPGLVITVDLMVGDEPVEFEGGNEFAFDELIGDLDCDEDGGEGDGDGEGDGEGGELPVTGSSTGLFVAGAAALLALGGGLYLVARRRRVTFTT